MAQSVEGGQEERETSRDPNRLLKGRLPPDGNGTPERDGCSQGIHRFGCRWQVAQELYDRCRHGALCHQLCFQMGEFRRAWQVPKPEQMRDLLERRCADQVVDVVASVYELPGLVFDLAQCCRAHGHPLEPTPNRFGCYSSGCVFLWIASCFWHRC